MISVIIPYNKDRGYLSRCIESIKIQTGVEYEIILSNSNKGVAYNFNRGLEKAKGRYCKFVSEDDYLPPSALHTLQEGIQNNFWIFANAIQEDGDNRWVYRPGDYSKNFMSLHENLITNRIHGGTTLYRTEMLQNIGGMDESLWTGEEYDMHMRLWSKGFVPGYINREVYVHTLWAGQKSRKYRKFNKKERDEQIKKIQARYNDPVQ